MFSAQAGQLANALKMAGLAPDAAHKIAAILGNGIQNLVRTNPESVDLTPASLKYVTPSVRKHELPGLDFRQADPDYRPYQLQSSEERPQTTPAANVRSEPASQQTTATYRVRGGKFTDVSGKGDAAQVDLRISGSGPIPTVDTQGNTLVCKSLRCESDSNLRFFIEDSGSELIWKLQIGAFLEDLLSRVGTEVEVVTGVHLSGGSLHIATRTIRVLSAGDIYGGWQIPVTACPEA